MVGVNVWEHHSLLFYVNIKVAFFIEGLKVRWPFYIPLTKWGMLQQLAEVVAVAAWGKYRVKRFYIKQLVLRSIEFDLVNGAARYYYIVAILEVQAAIHGMKYTAALVYKQHFIGIGVFKEIGGGFRWCRKANMQARIYEQCFAAFQVVGFRLYVKAVKAHGIEAVLNGDLWLHGVGLPLLPYACRRMQMIYE